LAKAKKVVEYIEYILCQSAMILAEKMMNLVRIVIREIKNPKNVLRRIILAEDTAIESIRI
jgi:hypothetical protein